jgi:hypothetical protein
MHCSIGAIGKWSLSRRHGYNGAGEPPHMLMARHDAMAGASIAAPVNDGESG